MGHDLSQFSARRKFLAAARTAQRVLPSQLPPVLFLTDPVRTPDPATLASNLPAGWGVIYRHFGDADRRRAADTLSQICAERGLQLLIAADPELARDVRADGVHWPARLRAQAARWRTRFGLMSTSHHPGRDPQPSPDMFDLALVSTVFPSESPTATRPIGAAPYRLLARASRVPLYALGGVTATNGQSISRSGGIAAIDGITSAFGRRSEPER